MASDCARAMRIGGAKLKPPPLPDLVGVLVGTPVRIRRRHRRGEAPVLVAAAAPDLSFVQVGMAVHWTGPDDCAAKVRPGRKVFSDSGRTDPVYPAIGYHQVRGDEPVAHRRQSARSHPSFAQAQVAKRERRRSRGLNNCFIDGPRHDGHLDDCQAWPCSSASGPSPM